MAEMIRPTCSGPLSTNVQQHYVVDVSPSIRYRDKSKSSTKIILVCIAPYQ